MADITNNSSTKNNHKMGASKIISIESTADGDIQTVEETTHDNNDSVAAFTHHLRDSWDEALDGNGDGDANKPHSSSRPQAEFVSVMFYISILGDVNESTLDKQQNNIHDGRRTEKETIESTAAFYFDLPSASAAPASTSPLKGGNKSDEETDDDKASFTNNIRSSWDLGQERDENYKSPRSSSSKHKPNNPSVQFLDSTTAFEPPACNAATSSPREDQLPFQPSPPSNVNKSAAPSQPSRLGNDSPISPSQLDKDIVVPIPLRPPTNNTGGIGRKHHRVFSGRSNPAMAHRRVNTRGDSAPTEFKFEGLNENGRSSSGSGHGDNEDQHPQQQRGGKKKAFSVASYEQPVSPATAAMPPPIPPQQPQYQQAHASQYPAYYHGTPPPSYDPYNNYSGGHHPPHPAPQPSYGYGTPPPPSHPYYNASPQSDAGFNYNNGQHHVSPVVSGYPQQSQQPPQYQQQQASPYHQQYPPSSTQSTPSGGYFVEGVVSSNTSFPPSPQHLAQPSLEEEGNYLLSPSSPQKAEKICTEEELFSRGSASQNAAAASSAVRSHHRKELSFNPLPYSESDNNHHRKQSSLGNFLATTALFDDPDLFYEDDGYVSAPGQDGIASKHSHNKTLSSASFCRSLSGDDFMRQVSMATDLSGDEKMPPESQHPPSGMQPQSQQYPPPQLPNSSDGYAAMRSSPVMSNDPSHHPGYYPYGSTPPAQGMWHQHHQPPTHPSMHQPPQQMQYHQLPPYQAHPQPPPCYSMEHPQQHGMPPPQSNGPPQGASAGYVTDTISQHQPMVPTTAPRAAVGQQPHATTMCVPTTAEDKKGGPRRKCSFPDCPNRVVQGGKCISHGARRKTCSHPGCTKNVKKAGLCSTHGPARKRCEHPGCSKVSVQGGRCIAHGAKKKVCSMEECTKQSILGGMCKKHYDEVNGVVKVRGASRKKQDSHKESDNVNDAYDDGDNVDFSLEGFCESAGPKRGGGGHQRGLSLFQDGDLMDTILNNVATATPPADDDGLHGLSI
eukprot:CAMPEP_0172302004 /NCGR_PEP_ID=MMETSP1058-20130122/3779_1 /TAXON_ID=83371 /ORGANISM="Detonula confervacea, Strain CCMP 353" /LENGTH=1007 /DNA_ID=CAMNT_0013012329 /DNA_START=175 /DNA_END=3199 /DNA_ORIENTATION=+